MLKITQPIRNLDYVILLCEDVAKMKQFYRQSLGLPVYREQFNGQWVELNIGSSLLTLRPRHMVQLQGKSYDAPSAGAAGAALQLAFRVAPEEVDAYHDALQAQSVAIIDPPADQAWRHRTLFFQDPEHNLLEIYADI